MTVLRMKRKLSATSTEDPSCATRAVFDQEQRGQSSAILESRRAADYVGFLDQDDEWYVDKLSEGRSWLANTEIDVLYTDSDSIDADDKVTFGGIHRNYQCGWFPPEVPIEDILFSRIFCHAGPDDHQAKRV